MNLKVFKPGGELYTVVVDPLAKLDEISDILRDKNIIGNEDYLFYHHGKKLPHLRPLRDLQEGGRILLIKKRELLESSSSEEEDEDGTVNQWEGSEDLFSESFDAVLEIGQISALYDSNYAYMANPEMLQQVSQCIQVNPTNIAPIIFHERMHVVRFPEVNQVVMSYIFTLLDLPLYELQTPSDDVMTFYEELPRSQKRIFDEMVDRGFRRDRIMRAMKATNCDREATIEELSSYVST